MFNVTQIHRYTQVMEMLGFTPQSVLSGSGITEDSLTCPDRVIDSLQYQIVAANMMTLTKNSALGLTLGQEIDYSQIGVLGYAMTSSSTIRRAIKLWLAYNQSLYGALVDCDLAEKKSGFDIIFQVLLPIGSAYQFCAEEFLTLSRQIGLDFSGQGIRYREIELTYPKPKHHGMYTKLFACPIKYNSSRNRISVTSLNLDTPVQSKNTKMNKMYLDFCEKMSGEISGKNPLETKINNYFLKSPEHLPSITELAKHMNLTERTLRRHLRFDGLSYRGLANRFRADLANEYLLTTNLSNKEIAFHLGFTDSSHFQKFFKNHFKMTPRRYREQR